MRVGVLASGSGTNFQALQDACACGYVGAEIAVVLTNKPDAGVLARAARVGVEGLFVDPKQAASREEYDGALLDHLRARDVELVCNAGWLRILSDAFVRAFENRALNVHPSLLPAFPGLHVIEQAFEWGVKVTGVTVHVVDTELDHGPIVAQRAVEIRPHDSLEDVERRIHLTEYALYPKALKLWTEGRVKIEGRRVTVIQDVEDPPWSGDYPPSLRGVP